MPTTDLAPVVSLPITPVLRFEQFNPQRQPNWRALRAQALVESGSQHLYRCTEDQYTARYFRFLLRYDRYPAGSSQRMRLFRDEPGLYYAHELYARSDEETRGMIEARILARETDEFIAQRLGTQAETVTWYELLFFNVRDRMDNRDWIWKTIMNSADRSGSAHKVDVPLKMIACRLFAYFGGPAVLDLVLHGFGDVQSTMSASKADQFMKEAFRSAIHRQAAVNSQMFEFNTFNMVELLGLNERLLSAQVAGRSGTAGGPSGELLHALQQVFESLTVSIGEEAERNRTPESRVFANSAIEPRAVEQQALASGVVPATLSMKQALIEAHQEEKASAPVDDQGNGK